MVTAKEDSFDWILDFCRSPCEMLDLLPGKTPLGLGTGFLQMQICTPRKGFPCIHLTLTFGMRKCGITERADYQSCFLCLLAPCSSTKTASCVCINSASVVQRVHLPKCYPRRTTSCVCGYPGALQKFLHVSAITQFFYRLLHLTIDS
ncbi:uncharacterized protein LOC144799143 [Lissotriton helveticus]